MARNPKLLIYNTLVEVCFRLEENLYFTATPYMKEIFISCLAYAQTKYNLKICHFVLMGNHVHLLLVISNTANLPKLVGEFKKETAFAINHLLGRIKHTVWNEGYDSPTVLDYDTAIKRIAYLYTNPQKANLVEEIENYPNQTSWDAFLSGGATINTNRIPRNMYPQLPEGHLSIEEQHQFADVLRSRATTECQLVITPYAWLQCFPESIMKSEEEVKNSIIEEVRKAEDDFRKIRTQPVLGAKALTEQDFRKPYSPNKFGRKMICLSIYPEHRKEFIQWAQSHFALRSEGGTTPPPGLFAPGGFLNASLIPLYIPIVGAIYSQ